MAFTSQSYKILKDIENKRYIKWTTISMDSERQSIDFLTGLIYSIRTMNKDNEQYNVPVQLGYAVSREKDTMEIYLTVDKECPYSDESVSLIVLNQTVRLLGREVIARERYQVGHEEGQDF